MSNKYTFIDPNSPRKSRVKKYTKFGQLVISKLIQIIATRCHILRLKFSKFDSRCPFADKRTLDGV